MVCSKAAWDISQAYQPYRPSYQELYERILALEGGTASLSMASPQSIEENLDTAEIPEEGSKER
jgi:O-acetylhomoserine/O-acetylserine sulfhydrylase-like pyridoxal-dependent enzyme